ncbi:MAG TPA: ribonuclease P protein component [Phycisphaerae bacterium]|nr:ribonuclease P protein component [Phycisphaerae bacterium]HDZ43726.1 ribonuclease P protein component [Phycisphaerae bacterium]
MMTKQRATRRYRVRHRADFARVFAAGQSARDELVTVMAVANGLRQARLGTAVSKRLGGAVRRNRMKRLIREAFRLIRCELPGGYDYVVLPRSGARLTVGGLQESLRRLAPRAADKAATT